MYLIKHPSLTQIVTHSLNFQSKKSIYPVLYPLCYQYSIVFGVSFVIYNL